MSFRPILGRGGVPVQQSLTLDDTHQGHLQMEKVVLGVVWEVKPADHFDNRYTRGKTRRGAFHTCSIIVLNDGQKCNYFLENVIITPDSLTGLDDYYEHLPRPSTKLVTGETLQPKLQGLDPYELDGDWCVVSFIGGNLDLPYVLRWWPHPKNLLDPATSGKGNPSRDGEGRALIQHDRYFRRVNGVEQVITAEGDVYFNTRWANSLLQMGEETPSEGRWARQEREPGGSIYVGVKSGQSFEMSWRKPPQGMGARGGQEDDLPQTNPRRNSNTSTEEVENTHILVNKTQARIATEEVTLVVSDHFGLESDDTVSIAAENTVDVSAESATITVDTDLNLGGTGGNTLIDSRWQSAWDGGIAAITATEITDLPTAILAIQALQEYLKALQMALATSLTEKAKAV